MRHIPVGEPAATVAPNFGTPRWRSCLNRFPSIMPIEAYVGRPVEEVDVDEIRAYLHHMVERNLSESSIKHAYCALKLIHEVTLGKPWEAQRMPKSKKLKRLPILLTQSEIQKILDAAPSLKFDAES